MRWIGLLIITVVIGACRKDEAPASSAPLNACGTVSGIHRTDVNGVLMFPYDSTDWRAFDTWCPEVEAFFADLAPVVYSSVEPDSLRIVCFPNPSGSQFRLGFFRDDGSRVDLRFVNTNHQLLWSVDSIMAPQWNIFTDWLGGSNGQLVRVYYRVTHTNGSAHRGHGDVQLGP